MSSLLGTSTIVRIFRLFLLVHCMRFSGISPFILLDNGQPERSRSGISLGEFGSSTSLQVQSLLLGHDKLILRGWYWFLPISNSPVSDLRSTFGRELVRVGMRFLTISTALLFLLKRAQLSIRAVGTKRLETNSTG